MSEFPIHRLRLLESLVRLSAKAELGQRVAEQLTRVGKIVLIRRDVRLLDHDLVEESPTLLQVNPSALELPRPELIVTQDIVGPRQVTPEYGIGRHGLDKVFPECECLFQERSPLLAGVRQEGEIVVRERQVVLEPDVSRMLLDQVLLNLQCLEVGSTRLGLVLRNQAQVGEIA